MKHLKLFENFENILEQPNKTINDSTGTDDKDSTFKDWIKKYHQEISTRRIQCNWRNLIDLEGIEEFKNLSYLNVSHNNIKELPDLSDLKNLRCLHVDDNKLTKFPNLGYIDILDFDNNEFTKLPDLSYLKNLNRLSCCENHLNNFENSYFSIDAFELGIDITDLNKFKLLNHLRCRYNLFSKRYEKYIIDYCKRKNIELYI